jgi:hypothetical protein
MHPVYPKTAYRFIFPAISDAGGMIPMRSLDKIGHVYFAAEVMMVLICDIDVRWDQQEKPWEYSAILVDFVNRGH